MKKTCESEKRFGKEGNGTEARNKILESFIRDSGDKAYGFAYNLSGNHEDARELVQEACYRVTRAWESFETSKPVGSWFFTILRNVFIDSRRRSERRNIVSLDLPLDGTDELSFEEIIPDGEEGIQESLERKEKAWTVRRALKAIPRKQEAVLRLCYMHGMRYDEAARSLGISEGTVRSRIFRARATLRNRMTDC